MLLFLGYSCVKSYSIVLLYKLLHPISLNSQLGWAYVDFIPDFLNHMVLYSKF